MSRKHRSTLPFGDRLKKIRGKLAREKLDALLVSDVANISYLSGFTNFSDKEREAYIFVGQNFAYIITDGRYAEAVKKQVPHLTLFERGHKKSIKGLFKKHQKEIKRLGIEENNLTVAEYKFLKKHFRNVKQFEVSNLRSIKTKDEISKIEKACNLGDLAFGYILKKIKAGVTEKEIAFQLENFIRNMDARLSFPPIIAFGKNSAVPHHQAGNDKLIGNGEFVLLDFGVKLENYCSDMTRTIIFGNPTDKQQKLYNTVLQAQKKAIDFISSAVKLGKAIKAADVDKVARDYIISQGYPSIPHSLGHGIGLQVHEHPSLSPKSKEVLKEGMVFSIEPGIYLEGLGGVRIEDLFVLEKNNLGQLTSTQRKLTVV